MPRKKSSRRAIDSFYPQHREVLTEAIDNGIIIDFSPLEYPIFMMPGAFARNAEEKAMKGSAAFDPKLFAKQNKLSIPPKKAQLRKELKKTLNNMMLTIALLNDSGADIAGQTIIMSPTKQSASRAFALMEKAYKMEADKLDSVDQKDALLVKMYAKALQELSNLVPDVAKMYKKHKKYFDALTRIKPGALKSKTSSKKKPSSKKKTTTRKRTTSSRKKTTSSRKKTTSRKKTSSKKTSPSSGDAFTRAGKQLKKLNPRLKISGPRYNTLEKRRAAIKKYKAKKK